MNPNWDTLHRPKQSSSPWTKSGNFGREKARKMSQEIMIKGEKCTLRKGKQKMLSVTYYKASNGKGNGKRKLSAEASAACVAYFVALQRKHEKWALVKLIFNASQSKGKIGKVSSSDCDAKCCHFVSWQQGSSIAALFFWVTQRIHRKSKKCKK